MKKNYDTPDFELVSFLLTEDVLGESTEQHFTEETIPEASTEFDPGW